MFTTLSPAKLNLFLHITAQRPDGFHELQTLFQLLDYGDTLSFEVIESPHIELTADKSSCGMEMLNNTQTEDNLIVRAARLLQKHSNVEKGARIFLNKQIPLGGGLGGGSSNAATTLLVLNRLWNCGLNQQELASMGQKLGADVPVFIYGESAWAEGVGEILTPITLPERWFLVLTPACHASTPEIFCHEQLTRDTSPLKIPAFPISDSKNDCQKVAILLYPEIGKALDWLSKYAPARMTGTGASVFANFDSKEQAAQVLKKKPDTVKGFIAKGVNTSAVLKSLYGK